MSACVESMFYVREKPWHGLGVQVMDAPTSHDALILAGLDCKVNTRSTDHAPLGIVTDRYQVVQNSDAFKFTDELLGEGVTYETAGSLQGDRKVWLLARMPEKYIIAGDEIAPYLVVLNSHDSHPRGLPEHPQPGPGSGKAHLELPPHRKRDEPRSRSAGYYPDG